METDVKNKGKSIQNSLIFNLRALLILLSSNFQKLVTTMRYH